MPRHRLSARNFSPLRLACAAAVVVACAAALWFLGRETVEERVGVVLTAEPWPAGSAGAFLEVPVPESLGGLFASPEEVADGLVSAVLLPEGVMVPASLLREPSPAAREGNGTLMRLEADRSLWPAPGPAAGDRAVFAFEVGGCALEVLELVAADEAAVTVVVDPESARALFGSGEIIVWESPAEGWQRCPGPPEEVEVGSRETLMRLEADRSLWPAPGPAAGDRAVFAFEVGGCALEVLELVAADEAAVTVVVDPESARALSGSGALLIWEAPAVGWEPC